ncbi:MAG TPA: hypothetical protein VMG35_30520 [Bryobacteraceae bacterium]|nr:hypothetical protein [Bryobacteraceae bacterium]
MALSPNWLRNSLLTGCALALPALAVDVPAGTQMQVRLKTKIASNVSKPNDPVETIVIAPVTVSGVLAIPAGVALHGLVTAASPATDPSVRATLSLGEAPVSILYLDGRAPDLVFEKLNNTFSKRRCSPGRCSPC